MASSYGYVPLVEVRRGDHVESVHHGAIAVVDDRGRLEGAAGDPGTVVFLRSAAKPIQALPLLASGAAERFGFDEGEIAVMIGSHGGEAFHVEAVRSILRKIGAGPEALRCGAHPPLHRPAARALRERGEEPSALHNNCSGKHAGMVALAVHLGAPAGDYLDPAHPVQERIRAAIEAFAGLAPGGAALAVDGCSAPTFALPLGGAALLYARLAAPEAAPDAWRGAARRAVAAMRARPEMVAGTGRLCSELLRLPGGSVLAKIGAEGVFGLGVARGASGSGVMVKIADGDGERARFTAALEALRQTGALGAAAAAALRDRFVAPVRTHRGATVGAVRPVFRLDVAA